MKHTGTYTTETGHELRWSIEDRPGGEFAWGVAGFGGKGPIIVIGRGRAETAATARGYIDTICGKIDLILIAFREKVGKRGFRLGPDTAIGLDHNGNLQILIPVGGGRMQ